MSVGGPPRWFLAACFVLAACSLDRTGLRVDEISSDGGRDARVSDGSVDATADGSGGADACTMCMPECATALDCPAETAGDYGECVFEGGPCDESGSESRSITRWACTMGRCTATAETETRACTRATEGTICGAVDDTDDWSECSGFGGECGETGSQERTVSAEVCRSGACVSGSTIERRECTRDTDGNVCRTSSSCRGLCVAGACDGSCARCASVCRELECSVSVCYAGGSSCCTCNGC